MCWGEVINPGSAVIRHWRRTVLDCCPLSWSSKNTLLPSLTRDFERHLISLDQPILWMKHILAYVLQKSIYYVQCASSLNTLYLNNLLLFCLTWEHHSTLSCHLANPFPPVTYNFQFLVCSFAHPEDICVDPSCRQLLLWSCKRRVKKIIRLETTFYLSEMARFSIMGFLFV